MYTHPFVMFSNSNIFKAGTPSRKLIVIYILLRLWPTPVVPSSEQGNEALLSKTVLNLSSYQPSDALVMVLFILGSLKAPCTPSRIFLDSFWYICLLSKSRPVGFALVMD